MGAYETLIHCLRDCPDSVAFWQAIKVPSSCVNAFSFACSDWLFTNFSSSTLHTNSIPWQTVFAFGIWTLWLHKNQIIFKAGSVLPDLAVCAISHASEFFYLMDVKTNAKNRIPISVQWVPPLVNWAKLNTDGSVLGDPGLARGGGVLRDSLGNWIGGFSRSIGITSCVQAELRALKDGLLLALDLEISKLEIEMDSYVAVESLKSTSMPNVFLRSIVDDCRLLLERFEATTIKHIYRETNGCANALAKTGCVQHVNISFYPSAPAHVLKALAFDNFFATRTRFVNL